MKFLTALQLGNSVTKACALSHIPRRTVYYWKSENPEFADAWADAIDTSVEELEDAARKRALDIDDPKSHLFLMFVLKKWRPEYRENFKTEVKHKHEGVQEFSFTPAEVDTALALLEKAKADAAKSPESPDIPELSEQD